MRSFSGMNGVTGKCSMWDLPDLERRRQMIGFWIWQEGVVGDCDKSSFPGAVEAKVWWEGAEETEREGRRDGGRGERSLCSEWTARLVSFSLLLSIFTIKILNKKGKKK